MEGKNGPGRSDSTQWKPTRMGEIHPESTTLIHLPSSPCVCVLCLCKDTAVRKIPTEGTGGSCMVRSEGNLFFIQETQEDGIIFGRRARVS